MNCKPTCDLRRKAYTAWHKARERCSRPAHATYRYYGGKGVKVHPEWDRPGGFDLFLAHIGLPPGPEYSLDRYPNRNGHYEPGNVRWATEPQQKDNRNRTIWLELNGRRQSLRGWAKELGVNYYTLYHRLKKLKWPPERVLTEPATPLTEIAPRQKHVVEYQGRTMKLTAWCRELNLSYDAIYQRLRKGMSPEEAFTTPSRFAAVNPELTPVS